MARQTENGKYILSAGEIGSYVVCPEAWRLRTVEQIKGRKGESTAKGKDLHQEWVKRYDETVFLRRSARLIVLLVLCAVLFTFVV